MDLSGTGPKHCAGSQGGLPHRADGEDYVGSGVDRGRLMGWVKDYIMYHIDREM
jgi:hypothetical protein